MGAVEHIEPVELEIVRVCHFKAKGKEEVTTRHRDGSMSTRTVKRQGCARCGKPKGDTDHLGAPPSMNVFGRSGDGFVYMNLKETWGTLLREHLERAGLPKPLGHVLAEGEITFPDRIRRDQGNYRVLLEKALGDALTAGGWLEDDDWSRYEFGGLAARYTKGESATRLMLFPRPFGVAEPWPVGVADLALPV